MRHAAELSESQDAAKACHAARGLLNTKTQRMLQYAAQRATTREAFEQLKRVIYRELKLTKTKVARHVRRRLTRRRQVRAHQN